MTARIKDLHLVQCNSCEILAYENSAFIH